MGRTRSWTATMQLARERRGVGATNEAITNQLLQRAVKAHHEEALELSRFAKSDSERAAARGLLDSLREGIVRLQRVAQ